METTRTQHTTFFGRMRARWRGESGSAMTEFIIGLPVFVLIFSGMGMLYRLNEEALEVKAKADADMWSNAKGQLHQMIPLVGGLSSVSSVGDLFQNGLSAGGIYLDSGAKVSIPDKLIPGAPGTPAKFTIGGIMGTSDDFFSHRLLNDMVDPTLNTSGFAGVVSSVVSTTGAAPAIAAGMRYGAATGRATSSFDHPWGGHYDFDSGQLDMPAPTAATHRIATVAMIRLQFATDDKWNKSLLEFNTDMDTSGSSDLADGDQCQNQVQDYQSCVDDGVAGGATQGDAQDSCQDKLPEDGCGNLGTGGAPSFDTSWCQAGMDGC